MLLFLRRRDKNVDTNIGHPYSASPFPISFVISYHHTYTVYETLKSGIQDISESLKSRMQEFLKPKVRDERNFAVRFAMAHPTYQIS
jgi:hypothetical protein